MEDIKGGGIIEVLLGKRERALGTEGREAVGARRARGPRKVLGVCRGLGVYRCLGDRSALGGRIGQDVALFFVAGKDRDRIFF
jgi:hypothetical protein